MQYFFLFLIVLATGCAGQNTNDKTNKIDTAKLFNPNNHPDHPGAKDVNIFKRNIVLTQPDFYANLNDKEYKFESLIKLSDFVKTNKIEIQKELLYVLADSNTAFKKIVSAIDALTENNITDYKVINVQQYFTPPEPVSIQTPSRVVSPLDKNDSTYFSITILGKGVDVKLFGQETKFKTTNDLDSFITAHKQDIKKIIIIARREVPDDKFKSVLEILKKHEFYKFNLVTK